MNLLLRGCRWSLREAIVNTDGCRTTRIVVSWRAQGKIIPNEVLDRIDPDQRLVIVAALEKAIMGGRVRSRPRIKAKAEKWSSLIDHIVYRIRAGDYSAEDLNLICDWIIALRLALHTQGRTVPMHERRHEPMPVVILDDEPLPILQPIVPLE